MTVPTPLGDDTQLRDDERVRVLNAQKQVLEGIAAGEPLHDVLDLLVKMIESLTTDGVIASVLLLDPDGIHLRHGAAPSLPAHYNEAIDGLTIGPKAGSCGTAAYRRCQVIVTDIETDPLWEEYRDLAASAGVRACWSTPIVGGDGTVLGTFAMYYPTPRRPDDADLALIEVMIRTASIAIERSRADDALASSLGRERRAREDLRFLVDVTATVTATFDYDAAITRVADLAVPALADVCTIDVVDDGAMHRAATASTLDCDDRDTERLRTHRVAIDGSHPVASALRTGDVQRGANFADAHGGTASYVAMLRRLGLRSYVCVPLLARGATSGVLTLIRTSDGPEFDDDRVALVVELAAQVALALDNARLYESAVQAQRQLALVARAGEALTSSLRLDVVVSRLCELTVPDIGDVCEVHVVVGDGRVVRHTRVHTASGNTDSVVTDPDALPAAVETAMASGRAVAAGNRNDLISGADARTVRDGIVVPLLADGVAMGTLAIARTVAAPSAPTLTPDVVPVIAGRAALAIDNARRFEHERTTAEILQRSLLPRRLPEVENLDIAARYHPGGPGVEIGGDWYDVIEFADGQVGLVMGDVMGRGIPAATVMGQLGNALRAFAIQVLEPSAALTLLNQLVQRDDDAPLATLFCGIVDPATGTLRYASAGHCPAVLATPDGTVSLVGRSPDPPLGAPFSSEYEPSSVDVPPGSTLILYTDGLIERRGSDLTERLEALTAAVQATVAPDVSVADICERLVEVLLDDEGDSDDVAVMAVRVAG
jgi:GAF domain-containing protein